MKQKPHPNLEPPLSGWRIQGRFYPLAAICAVLLWGIIMPPAALSRSPWPRISLVPWADGFEGPVHLTQAGDAGERVFVVEQEGRIRLATRGASAHDIVLDISGRVGCCGERGLLSMAFPPGFPARNWFYVDYTDTAGNTVISRFHMPAPGGSVADPDSEEIILRIQQPFANHNGGQIAFGPDGYLYIGTGDGGSGGDPQGNSQNTGVLLGKILRIDVESGTAPYGIPPDNPFVSVPGIPDEIWAYGLRNPWRFSFDRVSGDLFIADVGQNRVEEVNFQPSGSRGGENYGWNIMEGPECFADPLCDAGGLVAPVAYYEHPRGCSVTGGHVYRGPSHPGLAGIYLYGDFCEGVIHGLRSYNGAWQSTPLLNSNLLISGFGEDEAGEIYILDLAGGGVYRVHAHSGIMPDVRANGLDGPLSVNAGDTVSITVGLGPGEVSAQSAEWWLVAETPRGLFSFEPPLNWVPGLKSSLTDQVFPFPALEVFMGVLPPGRTVIHFGLDPLSDEIPQATWLDQVVVEVE